MSSILLINLKTQLLDWLILLILYLFLFYWSLIFLFPPFFSMCVSHSDMSNSLWPHCLSMEFSRQEYWSGLPFPSPGNLPGPGIEPRSPALQEDSLLTEIPRKIPPFFFSLATCKHIIFGHWGKVKVKVMSDCNTMNYTVHRILQAIILEWIAFPFSRVSSQPRDRT